MNILYADLETASRTPIKAGSYRYSEDARIIVQAYALGGGEIVSEAFDGPKLQQRIDGADIVVMHNGGLFDRVQLARHHACGLVLEHHRRPGGRR